MKHLKIIIITCISLIFLMNCSDQNITKSDHTDTKLLSDSKRDSIKNYWTPEKLAQFESHVIDPDSVLRSNMLALKKKSLSGGIEKMQAKGVLRVRMGGSYSTGFLISPYAVITSAQLVELAGGPTVNAKLEYWDGDNVSDDSRYLDNGTGGDSIQVTIYKHSGYIDASSHGDNIGLIVSSAPFKDIDTDDIWELDYFSTSERNIDIYGTGIISANGNITQGAIRGEEYVSSYTSESLKAMENDRARICRGDNGGPWIVNNEKVIGITSAHHADVQQCAYRESNMYATRINSEKISWLSSKLDLHGLVGCRTNPHTWNIACHNRALTATVTSSSYYSATYTPLRAGDGNENTKWNTASGVSGHHWIDFDFGSNVTINSYVIKHAEVLGETSSYNTIYWETFSNPNGSSNGTTKGWHYNPDQEPISNSYWQNGNGGSGGFGPFYAPFQTSKLRIFIHNPGQFYARIPEIEIN